MIEWVSERMINAIKYFPEGGLIGWVGEYLSGRACKSGLIGWVGDFWVKQYVIKHLSDWLICTITVRNEWMIEWLSEWVTMWDYISMKLD